MLWRTLMRMERGRRASLVVVPVLCSLAAFGLLRVTMGGERLIRLPETLTFTEDTAGQLLATVIGALTAMLAIVLAFSMLVVQLAMGQLSPRLVGFWYRDRHLKATLGIVVGALVYALLLLARVKPGFVPSVSTVLAAVLLLLSIGAFLSFVQHVGQVVRPEHVADRIMQVTLRSARRCLAGTSHDEQEALNLPPEPRVALRYFGPRGVLQLIHGAGLMKDARRLGVRVVMVSAAGDFLQPGDCVAVAYGPVPASGGHRLSLERHIVVGGGRLPSQDLLLGLRLLVDVAIRALSPAVNDPTTAVEMLERIGALLADFGKRRLGARWLSDVDGQERLCLLMPTWEDALSLGVAEIAEYSQGAPQVRRRLRALLQELLDTLPVSRHDALDRHLHELDDVEERRRDASSGTDRPDRQGFGPTRPVLA
ncbi:MAG: DUF2254 family protein [Myxococcales bacterium]